MCTVSSFLPLSGDFWLVMVFVKHRMLCSSLVHSLSFLSVLLGCVLETTHFSQTISQHLNSFPLVWTSILLAPVCVLHGLGCASAPLCLHPCVSRLPVVTSALAVTSACSFSYHSLEVSLSTAVLIFPLHTFLLFFLFN